MLPTEIELTMQTNVKNRNSKKISTIIQIRPIKPFLEIVVCPNGIIVIYYALYYIIF